MMRCIVPYCKQTGDVFPLPTDTQLFEKWSESYRHFMKRLGKPPIEWTLRRCTLFGICDDHFDPASIIHHNGELALLKNSVPNFKTDIIRRERNRKSERNYRDFSSNYCASAPPELPENGVTMRNSVSHPSFSEVKRGTKVVRLKKLITTSTDKKLKVVPKNIGNSAKILTSSGSTNNNSPLKDSQKRVTRTCQKRSSPGNAGTPSKSANLDVKKMPNTITKTKKNLLEAIKNELKTPSNPKDIVHNIKILEQHKVPPKTAKKIIQESIDTYKAKTVPKPIVLTKSQLIQLINKGIDVVTSKEGNKVICSHPNSANNRLQAPSSKTTTSTNKPTIQPVPATIRNIVDKSKVISESPMSQKQVGSNAVAISCQTESSKTPEKNPTSSNKNVIDKLPSPISLKPGQKVCVIPLQKIVGSSLTKSKIQGFIRENLGVNVPYDSKLFKTLEGTIKKFKVTYSQQKKNSLKGLNRNSSKILKSKNKGPGRPPKGKKCLTTKNPSGSQNNNEISEQYDAQNVIKNLPHSNERFPEQSDKQIKKKNIVKNKKNRQRSPRTFKLNFTGKILKKGNDQPTEENVLIIPATITNIYDKSQLEILCQTLIEAVYRFQNTDVENAEVQLVVSIKKEKEKNIYESECFGKMSHSDSHTSTPRKYSFLGLDSETRMPDFSEEIIEPEEMFSDIQPYNEVIISEAESTYIDPPVLSSESHGISEIKNLDRSSVETTAVTCHDHNYSPGIPGLFKNPHFLVRVFETSSKAKKKFGRPKTKVIVKPPPKSLLEKHEKEKQRFQKLVSKLVSKVKSKNNHIAAKNKKIKYLSQIVCETKGLKRINYPKEKKQVATPISSEPAVELIPHNALDTSDLVEIPVRMSYQNISQKEGERAVESLLEETPFTVGSLRISTEFCDNFEKRFSELYQQLVNEQSMDND